MIAALVFDFDGLLVDTESPAYLSWQEIYREHGYDLAFSRWAGVIGTIGEFDAMTHLQELVGDPLDGEAMRNRRRRRAVELVEVERPRPGVQEYLAEARRRGLRLAIASSGRGKRVKDQLGRLGMSEGWEAIVCADGDSARTKPEPVLYLEVLERLGVGAEEAIAFEDSPNGVRAAKRAELYCVAVPNGLTARLDLSEADLVIGSLADLPLDELLEKVTS